MELLILPSLILAALLFLALRDLKAERAESAAQSLRWQAERTKLVEDARTERAELLNRIQAPEVEVAKQWEPEETEMSLPYDDDDAFAAYREPETV